MIIGISGKINSGKDTIGRIIQYLTVSDYKNVKDILKERNGREITVEEHFNSFVERDYKVKWKIKKYGGKLKDIVCILLGCNREDLESHEFKDKELEKAWWYYHGPSFSNKSLIPYNQTGSEIDDMFLVKLTPRKLLQLLGTECGREIIHPNIWVNALFSDYKPIGKTFTDVSPVSKVKTFDTVNLGLPNWIITDVRFPNELQAVKNRDGISIRVNRGNQVYNETLPAHESETALDEAEFDYVIDNNGSISNLIGKVQAILEIEKII